MGDEDVNPATIGGSASPQLEDTARSGRLGRRTDDLSPILSPGHSGPSAMAMTQV